MIRYEPWMIYLVNGRYEVSRLIRSNDPDFPLRSQCAGTYDTLDEAMRERDLRANQNGENGPRYVISKLRYPILA